jgi:hypothetical protein
LSKDSYNPSIFLSNLIPVDYLNTLQEELLDNITSCFQYEFNVVVNLKKGSYSAVQSRESVSFSDYTRYSIEKGLFASALYKYLYHWDKHEKNEFLRNTSSDADPKQLSTNLHYSIEKIRTKKLLKKKIGLNYYVLFKDFKSLFSKYNLRECVENGNINIEKNEIFQDFTEYFKDFEPLAIDAMKLWYSNKIFDDKKDKEKQISAEKECNIYIVEWYKTLWECMQISVRNKDIEQGSCPTDVSKNFDQICPKIVFVDVDDAVFLAQYVPLKHEIQITNVHQLYNKVLDFMSKAPVESS